MTGQRKFLRMWGRTAGMPIGDTDDDKPTFLPITQIEVKRALAMRTFWIALHIITCLMIIAGNCKTLGWL